MCLPAWQSPEKAYPFRRTHSMSAGVELGMFACDAIEQKLTSDMLEDTSSSVSSYSVCTTKEKDDRLRLLLRKGHVLNFSGLVSKNDIHIIYKSDSEFWRVAANVASNMRHTSSATSNNRTRKRSLGPAPQFFPRPNASHSAKAPTTLKSHGSRVFVIQTSHNRRRCYSCS